MGNPGVARFGGLFRDYVGNWILGFHGHIGESDITKAEILGILQGLMITWDKNFKNLICYTNSTYSIHLIKDEDISYHRDASEIVEI
ncbi:Ribonuclease H-like superfamily [Sesbania bispinosa]|nr:Ribonuclease H-like superfamily [Sesbania bispinosa]